MSAFLFVHDLFTGAWCWERVLPLVRAGGHLAQAIDLPGHGRDRTPIDRIALGDFTERIGIAVASHMTPVVIVAHGTAGVWAAQAAQATPERVARIVYVAAIVPISGESCSDRLKDALHTDDRLAVITAREARERLFHDCSPDDVSDAVARLRPSPSRPLREPVWLSDDRYGSVPSDYIECTNDRLISSELQMFVAGRAHCERIAMLECGHAPYYADPTTFASHLIELGKGSLQPN